MSIVRAPRPSSKYTTIRNDVARDKRVSYRARGLLLEILSRPDNWRTTSKELAEESDFEGRDAIRTAMRELADAGYVKFVKRQNDRGQWVSDTHVFDVPQSPGPENPAPAPGPEKPTSGEPTPGDPALLEHPPEEHPSKKETSLRSVSRPAGPEFDDEANPTKAYRDAVWNALVELFGKPAPSQTSLYGRVTAYLVGELATVGEIRRRTAQLKVEWSNRGESRRFSVAALEKWWSSFDGQVGQATAGQVDQARDTMTREEWLASIDAAMPAQLESGDADA